MLAPAGRPVLQTSTLDCDLGYICGELQDDSALGGSITAMQTAPAHDHRSAAMHTRHCISDGESVNDGISSCSKVWLLLYCTRARRPCAYLGTRKRLRSVAVVLTGLEPHNRCPSFAYTRDPYAAVSSSRTLQHMGWDHSRKFICDTV